MSDLPFKPSPTTRAPQAISTERERAREALLQRLVEQGIAALNRAAAEARNDPFYQELSKIAEKVKEQRAHAPRAERRDS